MKKKLLLLLCVATTVPAIAQSNSDYNFVSDKGDVIEAAQIDYLVANDTSSTEFDVVMKGSNVYGHVTMLTPTRSTTGINTVNSSQNGILSISNGLIQLDSLSGNTELTIYSADGQQVRSFLLEKGNQVIDASFLPPGIYILKTASSVVKFIKK